MILQTLLQIKVKQHYIKKMLELYKKINVRIKKCNKISLYSQLCKNKNKKCLNKKSFIIEEIINAKEKNLQKFTFHHTTFEKM